MTVRRGFSRYREISNLFSCEALALLLSSSECSLTCLHDKFRWPSGREQVVGDHTAGVPPVPIPNTEVKPRRADCTARESVWESRSLPA
jgi:hypothetical protein